MARRAFELPVKAVTMVPEIDFSSLRYTACACSTTGGAISAVALGNVVGIVQEPQNIGQPMNVMFAGVSFCVFNGTVATGAEVEVSAVAGRLRTKTTGVTIGIVLAGGADGDIGCVLLK